MYMYECICRCATGYFGNPLLPGNYCQPCDCNGNTNLNNPNYCDKFTGRCNGCQSNTEGFNCETCSEGYYGRAINGDCHRKIIKTYFL